MNPNRERDGLPFLSTGVVASALEVKPDVLRAMISNGTLPTPQWLELGHRQERIYSLEWLLLANEQLNARRLSGLESSLRADQLVQFALRFEQTNWSVKEIAARLVAIDALWELCSRTLASDSGEVLPPLQVRHLSAGSPLTLLAYVEQVGSGLLGAGGVAALFIFLLKNPDKVAGAIPRSIAAWRDGWADAHDARVRQLTARHAQERFENEARGILGEIDATPRQTALSGEDVRGLENVSEKAIAEIEAPDPTREGT